MSPMYKILLVGFLTLDLCAPALAQDFTAEERAARRGDYNKFCKGTRPAAVACSPVSASSGLN